MFCSYVPFLNLIGRVLRKSTTPSPPSFLHCHLKAIFLGLPATKRHWVIKIIYISICWATFIAALGCKPPTLQKRKPRDGEEPKSVACPKSHGDRAEARPGTLESMIIEPHSASYPGVCIPLFEAGSHVAQASLRLTVQHDGPEVLTFLLHNPGLGLYHACLAQSDFYIFPVLQILAALFAS